MELYAGANTRYGFVSIFDECFKDIARIFILKGSSGCGKSTFMRRVAKKAYESGLTVDIIRCSADPDSLDGVIVHELGVAGGNFIAVYLGNYTVTANFLYICYAVSVDFFAICTLQAFADGVRGRALG